MAAARVKASGTKASVGAVPLTLDRAVCIPAIPRVSSTNQQSQILTLKQTAEYLRISKAHLWNVINGKVAGVPRLRYAKIGRRILIKRHWVEVWLEQVGQESLEQW